MAAPPPNPPLEVCCAGCGETLEVEPGLTEFICPDCHTPQALPPELMPRRRKALPLPRGVDSNKIQLPCASCNALLNVPHGVSRFACPKCGVDLAVDPERLRRYLASSSAATAAAAVTVVTPSGVRLASAIDVEPELPEQNNVVAHSPIPRLPVTSTVNTEQNHANTLPRAPVTSPVNVEQISITTTPSKALVPTSDNTDPICVASPTSMLPPPSPINIIEQVQLQEDVPGPPNEPVTRARKKGKEKRPASNKAETTLRRSKRLAKPQAGPTSIEQQEQGESSQVQSQNQLDQSQASQSQTEQIGTNCNLLYPPGFKLINAEFSTRSDEASEPDSNLSRPDPASVEHAQKNKGSVSGSGRKPRRSQGRGPTRCLKVWGRPEGDPIEITFNDFGQPVGKESSILSNFMGTIARDGKLVPLTYIDWRAVPAEYKDTAWHIVKSRFKVTEEHKRYVLKAIGKAWANWKCDLKRLHYDSHDNDEARLADIDERIVPDQWPFLVEFWGSELGQTRSLISKASRAHLKVMHTSGRKSFARLREEERLKRPNKEELNRAEVFILTHTRKDGTPVNEESAKVISQLREALKDSEVSKDRTAPWNDILTKVMGKDKRSHPRTYGLLPSLPESWGPKQPTSEELARIASEAKKLADEETKPMKEKMEAVEQRYKEMEEEMGRMRNTITAMHRMLSVQHLAEDAGPPSDLWAGTRANHDILRTPTGSPQLHWNSGTSDNVASSS